MISSQYSYDSGLRFAFSTSLYTGKERDSESGLDYFGARYYASNMGRFMSPDWSDDPDPIPYAEAGLLIESADGIGFYLRQSPRREQPED